MRGVGVGMFGVVGFTHPTVGLQSKASARPARGASPQWLSSPFRAQAPFGMTLKKRPPRGGAGRALAAVGGRVHGCDDAHVTALFSIGHGASGPRARGSAANRRLPRGERTEASRAISSTIPRSLGHMLTELCGV